MTVSTYLFRARYIPSAEQSAIVKIQLAETGRSPFKKCEDVNDGFERIRKDDLGLVLVKDNEYAKVVRFTEDKYYKNRIREVQILTKPIPLSSLGPYASRDRQVIELPAQEVHELLKNYS